MGFAPTSRDRRACATVQRLASLQPASITRRSVECARRAEQGARRGARRTSPRSWTPASGSSFEDGVRLFACPDTLALGWLANREREKRHGARTYYNFNIRLEATNVCVASCLFCSFARLRPGDPGSYTMSLEQAWDKLRAARRPAAHRNPRRQRPAPRSAVRLLHGACCAASSGSGPTIHLKCFTAVEIAFFADLYGMTDEQVLRELQDAGLDSLPGGGAEIFAERVRQKICARQVRRRSLPRDPPPGAPARHAHQRDDALRAHRDARGARRSHAARARAAGRDRRPPGVHPARVPSRQQPDAQAAGAERDRDAARARRRRG